MYSAITDIISIYKNPEYKVAIDSIWDNIVSKKLYITGGLGARSEGESFGDDYELPNFDAYAETCAAIANIFWNYRLFLLNGDAKYIDVLERTLYNGFLSGISIEGNEFFYTNPLASKGNINRRSWYKCPCCPTNIVRFIPQIPGYIYTTDGNRIFINLFIGSVASIELQDTKVKLIQETEYPWSGDIRIKISLAQTEEFTIAIRIPGWVCDKPVPSDLYSYLRKNKNTTIIKINGKIIDFELEKGYAIITHVWQDNDVIELNIPMSIRRVLCNNNVEENLGKVAIECGPIVYCIESVDNKVDAIFKLKLNDNENLKVKYQIDLLGGVNIVSNKILFIPYYSWANRGKSEMMVWIDREK